MTIRELYAELMKDQQEMTFNPPTPPAEIDALEHRLGLRLPPAYRELLTFFNGGCVYTAGSIVFGLRRVGRLESLEEANSPKEREAAGLPGNLLIIARENFGDAVCIELNPPFRVMLWDHETGRAGCMWDGLEDYLADLIESFR